MYRFICSVLTGIIAMLSVFGINLRPVETGMSETACKLENVRSGETKIEFALQDINTVELTFSEEVSANVKIIANGEEIYNRTSRDIYRFCAFETVETDGLTIVCDADISTLTVSKKTSANKDFRVTSYFVASGIQESGSVDPKCFEVITDAIIFGCVTFDKNGDVFVEEQLLTNALNNVRNAVGNRKTNIYFNVLGPGSDPGISDWNEQMASQGKNHSAAFKTGKLEKGFADIIEKYGFDGIFFDYEYPIERKYWRDFGNFLGRLDKATDKKIGIAVAEWDLGMSYKALKCVDMIELMQYDLFDSEGNHSSFSKAVSGFEAAEKLLIPREKLDLGVPFYGRPDDSGAFWPSYDAYADKLGKNTDFAETEYGKSWFNSWQTVYDKTAYAMSRGMGGMMVWHYVCDADYENELSLFGAMNDCITDRTTA